MNRIRRLCCYPLCQTSTWRFWKDPHRVPLLLQPGRMERALISMGREELQAMIDEQGSADLTCRFCDNVQHFSRAGPGGHGGGPMRKKEKNSKISS